MALPVLEYQPQLETLRLEVELSPRREEFFGNLRIALERGRPRRNLELNLSGVSSRNLALSVLLHVAALGIMLVLPALPFDSPIVAGKIDTRFPDPVLIYYQAPALPSMEDTGGSASGLRARAGGRSAFHPDQAIHVTRAVSLRDAVTDAPKLSLPQISSPAANLLSLSGQSAPLPLLSAPVELSAQKSKIRKPNTADETNLQDPKARLDVQKTKTIPANLVERSQVALPQPRLALRRQIATESTGSVSALEKVPLKMVPTFSEGAASRDSNASAGLRQELVISTSPGDVIGRPADGKPGSLAVTPKGEAQPGVGNEGKGVGVARGEGPGSRPAGEGTGSSASSMGPGSSPSPKAGISAEPGPGGAGNGSTTVAPGVHISGGAVTLDSFGPSSASLNPTATLPPRKPAPITIVATSRSGGGLAAYGAFKNRTVYTVYFDTAAGQAVLQFAAQEGTTAYSALTPPDPLNTDTPRGMTAAVVFSCVLDTSGHLQGLRVVSGSFPASAVEEAVRQWIFHPVLNGNQPVTVDALIGIGIGVH